MARNPLSCPSVARWGALPRLPLLRVFRSVSALWPPPVRIHRGRGLHRLRAAEWRAWDDACSDLARSFFSIARMQCCKSVELAVSTARTSAFAAARADVARTSLYCASRCRAEPGRRRQRRVLALTSAAPIASVSPPASRASSILASHRRSLVADVKNTASRVVPRAAVWAGGPTQKGLPSIARDLREAAPKTRGTASAPPSHEAHLEPAAGHWRRFTFRQRRSTWSHCGNTALEACGNRSGNPNNVHNVPYTIPTPDVANDSHDARSSRRHFYYGRSAPPSAEYQYGYDTQSQLPFRVETSLKHVPPQASASLQASSSVLAFRSSAPTAAAVVPAFSAARIHRKIFLRCCWIVELADSLSLHSARFLVLQRGYCPHPTRTSLSALVTDAEGPVSGINPASSIPRYAWVKVLRACDVAAKALSSLNPPLELPLSQLLALTSHAIFSITLEPLTARLCHDELGAQLKLCCLGYHRCGHYSSTVECQQ
ncbi:hypothetical protein B0H15DRAFT_966318 [Mycena belliarum]|uniref:Uncharacterized protein n=1 Tax=Mycena belliarum TaxID=1033014 RepID=A0AAD6TLX3_9AGAR|nr:hypothetical protein B0H15DRAFT_966318 [Mycena belliae]